MAICGYLYVDEPDRTAAQGKIGSAPEWSRNHIGLLYGELIDPPVEFPKSPNFRGRNNPTCIPRPIKSYNAMGRICLTDASLFGWILGGYMWGHLGSPSLLSAPMFNATGMLGDAHREVGKTPPTEG